MVVSGKWRDIAMINKRRNNLIITLTVFIVLIVSGVTYLIVKMNETEKKEGGIRLIFAPDSGHFSVDTFAKARQYITYTLTDDSIKNLETLETARQKLNSIKENKDTVNGVHFVIGDKTPYKYFIKAIDICSEKEPRVFAPNKNDIYAIYTKRSLYARPMYCMPQPYH